MSSARFSLLVAIGLPACGETDDVDLLHALTNETQRIDCDSDGNCPDQRFCHDALCREAGEREVGGTCTAGVDCKTGLVCVRRSASAGGTCEDAVRFCGASPTCAEVLECARAICDAFVGEGDFLKVTCGREGGRHPAQRNVLVTCTLE